MEMVLILRRLRKVKQSGKGYQASCPCNHNHRNGDKSPSLSINVEHGTLGLSPKDFFVYDHE